MLEVDGSAGGGQLVRTAVTLSMVTGEAVEIADVRGDRPTPGLKAQHRAVVETAADVCDADVSGVETGSDTVTFDPGRPTGGRYEADIGTAGSVTLLFDTFLPLAARLDEPLTLTATGGTDVKWSPPLSYYRQVKLPLLRRFGLAAAVESRRTGFYPAGGGRATLRLWPSSLSPVELSAPSAVTGARVYSTAATDLADSNVAERQADAAVDGLANLGVEVVERRVSYVDSASPGSVVVVRVDCAETVAGFDAFGAPEKRAEALGNEAVEGVRPFVRDDAAVDEYAADQLLVFLALVGGSVRIPRVTDHVSASLGLLETFDRGLTLDESASAPLVGADRSD